jgi:cytochrome c556
MAQDTAKIDQMKDHETTADVPELSKFHKIIYPIWHKYYPNKDYEGLKKSIPEIETLAEGIYKAELPGILRDKKKAWEDAIITLKENIANFKEAADKNENEKLLDAAEKLHAQYEKMVRIVKPMVKELDAFHVVLYNIYHKYLPEFKLDELKKAVPLLAERKDTLMTAVLPKPKKETPKYLERVKAFDTTRKDLSAAVDELVKVMSTDDKDKIKKAIEKVHTKYQNTEKVFD